MTAPQPIPLDSQLCFSLYGTTIAINRTYKPMLDAMGITYPQYLVLSTLWEGDGQTISAIADRLALEPSTITPLVKRLEAAGFVQRLRSTKDERLVGVHLTDKCPSSRRYPGKRPRGLFAGSPKPFPAIIVSVRST